MGGAAREAPSISMEPAGIVFLVGIQTQRTHAESVIALERTFEFITDGGVARSLKIDKEDGTAKCSRKEKRAFAHDVRHGAGPARGREREKKLAFGLECGEPCGQRMRGAGANDDHIGWIEWALRPVGMNDGDSGPRLERHTRTGRERLVDFDGDDAAMWANKLGEDG